ncbi:phosphoglycolate phosphatase [Inhella inkyongensis]|uniref:phosphoglycolate phosphatase n=1 Tax=Inhella inkyongensis TaxID=392593 RepID=A0A840S320_9BURK|nr:phosphoglycolate phosphatase [Inhella inkyongensis]MBB5203932.1 phosphoglycolate phosphatase [Inhella inkyongensis]
MRRFECRAVLFDLDGTLIDSAPDLAGAANHLREARGLAPLPLAALRPWVGTGARGMLKVALHLDPDHTEFEATRDEFLAVYERRLLQDTRAFSGVPALLAALVARGLPWGVVTNKAERFALPICRDMPLLQSAAAVVAGDTTTHAKPHPMPLLEAARRLGVAPEHCIYVGDDERDMQAARAAGMPGIVARWGYLGHGDIQSWGAEAEIEAPEALLALLA